MFLFLYAPNPVARDHPIVCLPINDTKRQLRTTALSKSQGLVSKHRSTLSTYHSTIDERCAIHNVGASSLMDVPKEHYTGSGVPVAVAANLTNGLAPKMAFTVQDILRRFMEEQHVDWF